MTNEGDALVEPTPMPATTNWIFGYGSLIWRPDFQYLERVPAHIVGYARRFWQGSPDHRGTPEAMGRVVTLVPSDHETCRGVAYRVSTSDRAKIIAQLDVRESGGYSRLEAMINIGHEVRSTVYVANPANAHYLGPRPTEEMAAHIKRAHGPSGPNLEYLLRLQESLADLDVLDEHVEALVALTA